MVLPRTTARSATRTLPLFYRLTLTTIEPLFALVGSLLTLLAPENYLRTLTNTHPDSLILYNPATSFLYTQLCGGWLLFAFNEAVVLRMVDDLRVWTLLCWGMLLSDACYCWSCAEAVGGWGRWVRVVSWGLEDWVVFVTTLWPALVRVCVVMGVGFRREVMGDRKGE